MLGYLLQETTEYLSFVMFKRSINTPTVSPLSPLCLSFSKGALLLPLRMERTLILTQSQLPATLICLFLFF